PTRHCRRPLGPAAITRPVNRDEHAKPRLIGHGLRTVDHKRLLRAALAAAGTEIRRREALSAAGSSARGAASRASASLHPAANLPAIPSIGTVSCSPPSRIF